DDAVFVKGQVILLHSRKLILDGEPAGWEGIAQMFQTVRFPFDSFAKIGYASAVRTIGFDEVTDYRILLLQSTAVEIKRVFFNLIQHYKDWRVATEAGDKPKPVVCIHIFAAFATVEHQHI